MRAVSALSGAVLEVEGSVARAELQHPRKEAPEVAQDRQTLRREVGVLQQVETLKAVDRGEKQGAGELLLHVLTPTDVVDCSDDRPIDTSVIHHNPAAAPTWPGAVDLVA